MADTTTTDPEVETLIRAWRGWDASPAWLAAAADMVAACEPLADRLGIEVPEFRDRLSAAMRRQVTEHPYTRPEVALAEVLAG